MDNIIEPESMYVIENMNKELEEVQNENIELQKQIREKDRKLELMELLRKNQLMICSWYHNLKKYDSELERAHFWYANGINFASMFDYDLSENVDNHIKAVNELNKKLGWSGEMAYGGSRDGDGFTFVFIRETINLIKENK